MKPSDIVTNYLRDKQYSLRQLAEILNEELAGRPYQRTISHAAIGFWATGVTTPDPGRFEWIAGHTEDAELRSFAERVLLSLAQEQEFDGAGLA